MKLYGNLLKFLEFLLNSIEIYWNSLNFLRFDIINFLEFQKVAENIGEMYIANRLESIISIRKRLRL